MGQPIQLPIPRLTYQEAMDRYGSDKPDIRFGLELNNISDVVSDIVPAFEATLSSGAFVRFVYWGPPSQKVDALAEVAKTYRAGGLAWLVASDAPGLIPSSRAGTDYSPGCNAWTG